MGNLAILCFTLLLVATAPSHSAHAADAPVNRGLFSVDGTGLATSANGGTLYRPSVTAPGSISYTPCVGGLSQCHLSESLRLVNTLAPCEITPQVACIKSVFASEDGNTWTTGTYRGERSGPWSSYAFPGVTEAGFGPAKDTNLYSFEGLTKGDSRLFEVDPKIEADVFESKPIDLRFLSSKIIEVVTSDTRPKPWSPHVSGVSGSQELNLSPCLFQSDFVDVCWQPAKLSSPTYFRLTLDLPVMPSGWVTGRLVNPAFDFRRISNGSLTSEVEMTGQAITVPKIAAQYWSDNAQDKATWDLITAAWAKLNWPFNVWDSISKGMQLEPTNIDLFLAAAGIDASVNQAASDTDEWVTNLRFNATVAYSGCQVSGSGAPSDDFKGFVGSNALVYENELPRFDPATQELTYRMAAPHLQSDGKPLLGTYSLLVTEAQAKCIWGISGSLGKATVSVSDSDGSTNTVVSDLGIRNGVVHFQASGFGYSEVKIASGFAAPKPTAPSSASGSGGSSSGSSGSVEANIATPVAKSIICLRIKKPVKTKIVSSISPKCPAGYKLKH